jgi:hypothetical protein
MNKFLRFTIILVPFMFACEGKKETSPSYIHVNKIDFKYDNISDLGNGGTAITDVWIFDNSELLGVFELPATVAVAASGNHEIKVGAGIKLNGIASTREAYSFYQRWSSDIDLIPFDTVSLSPIVSYYPETGISFKEDFENVVVKIDTIPISDVPLIRTLTESTEPEFLGRYVGSATITADKPGFKALTQTLFLVPTSSSLPIYLELDYKCNQEFVVSALVQDPGNGTSETRLITLRSTVTNGEMIWKHIYIDLTDSFIGQVNATGFGFSFTALYNSGNSEGLIYLDNPKVVNTK